MKEFSEYKSSWGWKNDVYKEYSTEIPNAEITINSITYDLTEYLLSNPGKDKKNECLIYSPDDSHALYILSYNYTWNEDTRLFKEYSVHGYYFWK